MGHGEKTKETRGWEEGGDLGWEGSITSGKGGFWETG